MARRRCTQFVRSRNDSDNEYWKGHGDSTRFARSGDIGGAGDTEDGDASSMSGSEMQLLAMK